MPYQTFFNLDEEKRNRIIQAALDEFSVRSYESAKLSNIIRDALIPRGSLYQYFKDKKDLYLYLLDCAKHTKMAYINEYTSKKEDIPFFELIKGVYIAGIKFAVENPKFVKMMSLMLLNKNEIYQDVLGDGIQYAIDYYKALIEKDKAKGRIKADCDAFVLAKLITDLTVNISVDEVNLNKEAFDFDKMLEQVTKIMSILEHGVLKENENV